MSNNETPAERIARLEDDLEVEVMIKSVDSDRYLNKTEVAEFIDSLSGSNTGDIATLSLPTESDSSSDNGLMYQEMGISGDGYDIVYLYSEGDPRILSYEDTLSLIRSPRLLKYYPSDKGYDSTSFVKHYSSDISGEMLLYSLYLPRLSVVGPFISLFFKINHYNWGYSYGYTYAYLTVKESSEELWSISVTSDSGIEYNLTLPRDIAEAIDSDLIESLGFTEDEFYRILSHKKYRDFFTGDDTKSYTEKLLDKASIGDPSYHYITLISDRSSSGIPQARIIISTAEPVEVSGSYQVNGISLGVYDISSAAVSMDYLLEFFSYQSSSYPRGLTRYLLNKNSVTYYATNYENGEFKKYSATYVDKSYEYFHTLGGSSHEITEEEYPYFIYCLLTSASVEDQPNAILALMKSLNFTRTDYGIELDNSLVLLHIGDPCKIEPMTAKSAFESMRVYLPTIDIYQSEIGFPVDYDGMVLYTNFYDELVPYLGTTKVIDMDIPIN